MISLASQNFLTTLLLRTVAPRKFHTISQQNEINAVARNRIPKTCRSRWKHARGSPGASSAKLLFRENLREEQNTNWRYRTDLHKVIGLAGGLIPAGGTLVPQNRARLARYRHNCQRRGIPSQGRQNSLARDIKHPVDTNLPLRGRPESSAEFMFLASICRFNPQAERQLLSGLPAVRQRPTKLCTRWHQEVLTQGSLAPGTGHILGRRTGDFTAPRKPQSMALQHAQCSMGAGPEQRTAAKKSWSVADIYRRAAIRRWRGRERQGREPILFVDAFSHSAIRTAPRERPASRGILALRRSGADVAIRLRQPGPGNRGSGLPTRRAAGGRCGSFQSAPRRGAPTDFADSLPGRGWGG